MRRAFFFFLLLAVTVALQVSALPKLGLSTTLYVPLMVLLLLLLFDIPAQARFFAASTGFLLDLFSPLPFGVHTVGLTLIVLLCEALMLRFFTNRSLYATAFLTWIATGSFLMLLVIANLLALSMGGANAYTMPLTPSLLWLFAGNTVFAVLFFYARLVLPSPRRFPPLRFAR